MVLVRMIRPVPCCLPSVVAVSTESDSSCPRVGMALVAERRIVIMPRSLCTELSAIGSVDAYVGTQHSVPIAMAAAPRTCWIGSIMAGCAILNVPPGLLTVIGQPREGRVAQWDTGVALMTVVAEGAAVVASCAVCILAFGIETMRELVVQFVDLAAGIITPMTVEAE